MGSTWGSRGGALGLGLRCCGRGAHGGLGLRLRWAELQLGGRDGGEEQRL